MWSLSQTDPDYNVSQPKLSEDECRDYQQAINRTIYKNLLEPESVMKYNKDYCFAIIPTDECETLPYILDDKRELEHSETAVDKKNIICNKFTECFTMGMVARLRNQIHIDEKKIEDCKHQRWLPRSMNGRVFSLWW